MAADGLNVEWASHVNVTPEQKQDASYIQHHQEHSGNVAAEADGHVALNYRVIETDVSGARLLPIQGQQQLYGWLTLYPNKATALNAQEEMLLNSMCAQLALKLENARIK